MTVVIYGNYNGKIIVIIMVIIIIIIIIIIIAIFIVMIFKWRYNNCGRKRKERSANYGIYYRSDES